MAYKPSAETLARAALARSKMSGAKKTASAKKKEDGKSAAAAKRVKVEPRKTVAIDPGSVRAQNAARQQAYMAKGGRQPIGAMGSGGSNVMAGAGQSTIKDLRASIKAGFNPRVSLDPYQSERAKKTKNESVDEAAKPDASMAMTNQLKMKMISDKDKRTLGKVADLMAAQKKKDKPVKEETVTEAERVAGYKMPAHVAAGQKKFDAQAKGQNKPRPQAGTLAAAKMKKEAADPGSMRVVNKKVIKTAEKMINAAKGKVNKVDVKPTIELEKYKD